MVVVSQLRLWDCGLGGEGRYRREEEGVLLDFLMAPWAMVR